MAMDQAEGTPMSQPLIASGTGDEVASGVAPKTYRTILQAWGELVKVLCCPLLCCEIGPIAVVEQGWVGVLTRFGVYERQLPPGLYVYNCMTQKVKQVCMKMQTIEVPRQAAMTKDNLSVQVDAVSFITVVDPSRATFRVESYQHAVKILAASTLLRVIGEHDLLELFRERNRLNGALTQMMQDKTAGWGVQVAAVEIRDITIADTMQRAMAQIAEANREAEAKVIVAQGQKRAASILADAAAEMGREPLAMQLQWFETLRSISAEKNSTVIVPDSVVGPLGDLVKSMRQGGGGQRREPAAAARSSSSAGEHEDTSPPAEQAWLQVAQMVAAPAPGGGAQ
eukprot:CAMPEP_0176064898 /NCGR_PEP_ID=MMETSP0120_2-20121206/32373_1 /TAXON_ID=160619 /ORGANISM="Kryptoperidinium foliaceum, Strain CCMP 1326" /LENGTH=339 /DNA_ID=CAMNT_0017398479 /DNA_START=53 /DNA_END=1072 /DNA_ORIENTATION=-